MVRRKNTIKRLLLHLFYYEIKDLLSSMSKSFIAVSSLIDLGLIA